MWRCVLRFVRTYFSTSGSASAGWGAAAHLTQQTIYDTLLVSNKESVVYLWPIKLSKHPLRPEAEPAQALSSKKRDFGGGKFRQELAKNLKEENSVKIINL